VTSGSDEARAHELVIIRRHGGGEEAPHKGGVWKIAYADFMTAMMAFFLVMWLINATDNKTLTQVATYFNPLKLTDKATSSKGPHDLDPGAKGQSGSPSTATQDKPAPQDEHGAAKQKRASGSKTDGGAKKESETSKKTQAGTESRQHFAEEQLFADPYAVLSQLAAQAPAFQGSGDPNGKGAEPGQAGGTAYRDPFDPSYWRTPGQRAPQSRTQGERARDAQSAQARGSVPGVDPEAALANARPDSSAARGAGDAQRQGPTAGSPAAVESQRAALDRQIHEALGTPIPGQGPDVEVRVAEDGVLVSLADEFDFGMFAIGSAEPRPELVIAMEKIAGVLKAHAGPIVIRGHTDARPFRSQHYDNWRLSSARAHMAYYMLVRGGISEQRVERIEGHADHSLRVPADPEAAQNRRIEILLRRVGP
jgi:chemotaxis protein MotB